MYILIFNNKKNWGGKSNSGSVYGQKSYSTTDISKYFQRKYVG